MSLKVTQQLRSAKVNLVKYIKQKKLNSSANWVRPQRECAALTDSQRNFLMTTISLLHTSAGTLNFSTTPSSKKQRMPHLMSSTSDNGKSLKRNSCSSTVLASGMVVFCMSETNSQFAIINTLMRNIALFLSWCLPTVCTSPSDHSLLEQSQTCLECSVGK